MKTLIACHEDDAIASKVVAHLAVLLTAGEGREYRWRNEKGCKVGYGSDPVLPHIIVGGPRGFNLVAVSPPGLRVGEHGVLITTYRPSDHHAFDARRPRNLFSIFSVIGDHTSPAIEGFRSVVFVREDAVPDKVVPAAAQQARHAFFLERKAERFRNCGRVSAHELTTPEPRRRRSYHREESIASSSA
jgi:hypothetical protein